ncbi:hypothetical protein QE401_002237 [Pseudoroseomonas cervicalis]|nr:hypothetical protein [Pseudoroseomonas cervicalis]
MPTDCTFHLGRWRCGYVPADPIEIRCGFLTIRIYQGGVEGYLQRRMAHRDMVLTVARDELRRAAQLIEAHGVIPPAQDGQL